MEGDVNLELPNGTKGYGSPYHGARTLRNPNNSSNNGDRPDRSQDAPEGSEIPWSPSWKFAFTMLTEVELVGSL